MPKNKDKIPNTFTFELTRICSKCGETTSKQWRKGPDGKISLCNSCGLRFVHLMKKEEKILPKEPKPMPLSFILNPIED